MFSIEFKSLEFCEKDPKLGPDALVSKLWLHCFSRLCHLHNSLLLSDLSRPTVPRCPQFRYVKFFHYSKYKEFHVLFPLFLQQLSKYTEAGHPDSFHIENALETMKQMINILNDSIQSSCKLANNSQIRRSFKRK